MELFGTTHLLTLLIGALFGAACIMARRRGHFWPVAILAFLNLSAYAYNQWVYVNLGHTIPLDNILPFHLCDIAAFLAGFALLTPRPLVRELCYCWGLAGTLQALLTPNLPHLFPHPIFFSFFIHHGIIVITAAFLTLAEGWRPRPGTFPRVLIWNQVYFFAVLAFNWLAGTNFGFLMRKPEGATLFDHLGPWPYYLIWVQLLASAMIALFLLPFSKRINVWRFR
ncbi:TIGR02206 family membrane protein [Akkermansiaceae bacterium]|nr:TIGR02206 family membrane protein [Akkermansiaceae bacterium]